MRFTREGRTVEQRLSQVRSGTADDLILVPGDRIELIRRPRTYTVFGATGRASQINFENGDKWRVDVRFRYRIDGGNLVMWLELVRPHKVVEQAVKDLREKIAAATELQILNGAPNTARN